MSAIRAAGEKYYREQAILGVLPAWAIERARQIVGTTPDRLRDFVCYVASSTWIALALAAAAAGTQYYNTQKTAKRQDQAAAQSIRNQSAKQKIADAQVAQNVEAMKGSTAEASRREALDSYTSALRSRKQRADAGLTPNVGSDRFVTDSQTAAQAVDQYGATTADLMAKADAPGMQRREEAFGQSRLATDLALTARQASGQSFLDKLRFDAVRRNAGLDAAAALMNGAAGGVASGGWGSSGTAAAGANTANAGSSLYLNGYRGLGSLGW